MVLLLLAVVAVVAGVIGNRSADDGSTIDSESTSGLTATDPAVTGAPDGSAGTASAPMGTPIPVAPTSAEATCVAEAGQDAAGRPITYEPFNAIDDDVSTTWRCAGDGVGQSLVVRFAGPVRVATVGILPGYAKVDGDDGSDRFVQNRKVTKVRYEFDGGVNVEAGLAPSPQVQSTAVDVVSTSVRIVILESVAGSSVTNNRGVVLGPIDRTPISEVVVTGVG